MRRRSLEINGVGVDEYRQCELEAALRDVTSAKHLDPVLFAVTDVRDGDSVGS